MIPVLAFSFGILDLCKIMMAKDAVTGTTNLALNAGLTSYDKVLKDMYGIMATSKSSEDLSEQMSKYYIASLNSSGIEGVDGGWVQDIISDLIGGAGSAVTGDSDIGASINNASLENNQNFMVVTPVANAEGNFITVDALATSAASNPAVLERQIVEHMKYRAPVNLALGMLEKLNAMKDIPNMTNAQNEKIEFERKLNTINNAAIDLYTLMMVFFHNNKRMENASLKDFDIVYDREKTKIIAQYQYLGDTSFAVKDCEKAISDQLELMEKAAVRIAAFSNYGEALFSGSLELKMDSLSDTDINAKAYTDNETEDELGEALTLAAETLYLDKVYTRIRESYADMSSELFTNGKVNYDNAYNMYCVGVALSPAFKDVVDVTEYYSGDSDAKWFAQQYEIFMYEYAAMEIIKEDIEDELEEAEKELEQIQAQIDDTDNPSQTTLDKKDKAQEKVNELDAKLVDLTMLFNQESVRSLKSQTDTMRDQVKSMVESQYKTAETEYETAAGKLADIYLAVCKQYLIIEEITKSGGYIDQLASVVAEAQAQSKAYQNAINSIQTTSQKNSSQLLYDNEAATLSKVDVTAIESLRTAFKDMKDDYLKAKIAIESFWILSSDNAIVFTIDDGNELYSNFLTDDPGEEDKFHEYMAITAEDQVKNITYTDSIKEAAQKFARENRTVYHTDADDFRGNLEGHLVSEEYAPVKPDGIAEWTDNGASELICPEKISSNPTYQTVCDMSKAFADDEGEENQNDSSAADAITNGATAKPSADGKGSSIPGNSFASEAAPDNKESEGEKESDSESDKMEYSDIADIKTFSEYAADESLEAIDMGGAGTEGFKMEVDATSDDHDAVAKQASSAMTAVGDMMKVLGDIFEGGRDSLYVTEYLTSNFSCATTNKVGGGKTVYSEKMLNGQYFETKDKGALSVAYRSELEYILYGFSSPEANVAAAGAIIFGIRFALNLIYSYTDSEIRATTLSAATAIGGIFPFSIPLIQTVLHIALAIAESSCDLFSLMDGAEVPLFKTKATWVCKGSNIVREVAERVVTEVVNTAIDKATDALTTKITEMGDSLNTAALQKCDEYEQYINQQINVITEEVHSAIMTPIHEVIQQIMMEYDAAIHGPDGDADEKAALKELLDQTLDNAIQRMRAGIGYDDPTPAGETDYVKEMKKAAFDYVDAHKSEISNIIYNNMQSFVDAALNTTKETLTNAENSLDSVISNLLNGVEGAITDAVGKFKEQVKAGISKSIDTVVTKLNEGVEMTAEELKSELSNAVRGGSRGHKNIEITGKDVKSKDSDFAIPFTYKDYLYVFTLIGSMANNANMLQRTAQMMAANCRNNGEDSDYDLNGAKTVLRADVQAKVGTVFYGGRFTEDKRLDLSGKRDFEFSYSSYMGY